MSRPSRTLPRTAASLVSFFAAMAAAHAGKDRTPPDKDGDPPDRNPTEKDSASADAHPLLFAAGADAMKVSTDRGGFTRLNTLIGASLIPVPWLELSSDLRIGRAGFVYHGDIGDDATLDGELSRDGHVTLTSGVRVTVLERRRVRWRMFAEYETSFGSDALDVDSVSVGFGGSDLDLTDYLRQHGRFAFSWHRVAVGTGIRVETGRVSPTLSVGIERLSAAVDVGLDDDARSVIGAFGKDASSVEKRHALDHDTISFYPGIDIRLPHRMHLEIQATVVPISDGWAYGAGIRYTFRP